MISVLQWTEFPRRSGSQTSRRLFVLIVIGHTLLVISAEAFIGVPLLRRHCTAMTAKSSPSERRVCLQPEPFCFIWLLKRRNEAVSFGEHMGLDTSLIIHKASVSCVPVDCCVATSVFLDCICLSTARQQWLTPARSTQTWTGPGSQSPTVAMLMLG